jgi:hypothetical protein
MQGKERKQPLMEREKKRSFHLLLFYFGFLAVAMEKKSKTRKKKKAIKSECLTIL